MEEIEAKFLGIDPDAVEVRLAELGATFSGEKMLYATSFDFPGFPLDTRSAWVRLRDEGGAVKLAFKQRLGVKTDGGNDDGMKEVEVVVEHFDRTADILRSIGMVEKFSIEKKRRSWAHDGVSYDVDTWPRLEPYLEIETDSWEKLEAAARKLGLDPAEKKICSASQIYKMAGINDQDFVKITFEEWIPRSQSS